MLSEISEHWRDARNRLLFRVRQSLQWGRGPYTEKPEPKDGLFENAGQETLAERLIQRYGLEYLGVSAGCARFLENLTVLAHLETLMDEGFSGKPRWLDVGAKNWSYVDALHAFATKTRVGLEPDKLSLVGLELDPYRRYTDLHNRREYAEAFIRPLSNAYYKAGDIFDERGQYGVITHFLPFVFKGPLLGWGLPGKHFKPEALLAHLATLLAPGGVLLVVNQGEDEAKEQQRLLEKQSALAFESVGQLPDPFAYYRYPRFGFRCRK